MTETQAPALDEQSHLARAVERVGDRWTLLIVEALLQGPLRFGDLKALVSGIAPNILSARLKSLEQDGIVIARPYSDRPVRMSYELSATGRELAGALRLLAQWGAAGSEGGGLRHAACGTPVEARWYCPTCDRPVSDTEDAELRYL